MHIPINQIFIDYTVLFYIISLEQFNHNSETPANSSDIINTYRFTGASRLLFLNFNESDNWCNL